MIEVSLDRDLEVKVQKFAKGIGMDVSDVIEAAVHYAVRSRYPDNALPGQPGGERQPDQGLQLARSGPAGRPAGHRQFAATPAVRSRERDRQ